MSSSRYPLLYEINTRVWLTELARMLGRPATLDDIPDVELDRLTEMGFEWIWMLGVWQTGQASRHVSRTNPEWREEFQQTLPDLTDDDIPGSCFAVTSYVVHQQLGGDAALARLRERLLQRDLKLMLDFVPNHTALDHPWIHEHPDYYVSGSEQDLAREPRNYTRVKTDHDDLVLAYGRDPFFPGWPDTLQLNYANPDVQSAMTAELMKIANQCDGVRCDMAMLVLPDIFERTWGMRPQLFWPHATSLVRQRHPEFCFMAEVYWDREWELQQQGFQYTYDKRLYDRLREGQARPVRDHLHAGMDYQSKLARFVENHDEPRAAATFPLEMHKAAAVITFLSPGLRFFHQGEFEGRLKRIAPHLNRAPVELVNEELRQFYQRLRHVLHLAVVRNGAWSLLDCTPAWDGNWTHDCFLVFAWNSADGEQLVVAVNYAPHHSQCHVRLPFSSLADIRWNLQDLMSDECYEWHGRDLTGRGLYLDMCPWQAAVYQLTPS